MSFEGLPPKAEVLGWDTRALADYMKKLKLSGCDKAVMKGSINGARFLRMTESDLRKFPSVHAPLISKICSDINRNEEKKRFGLRFKEQKHPKQDFVQEAKAWDSDEFEDSDDDYEEPEGGEMEDSYICALDEEHLGGEEGDGSDDNDYEPPPSKPQENPRMLHLAKPMADGAYIDSVWGGPSPVSPTSRTPRPPQPSAPKPGNSLPRPPLPRMELSNQKPLKAGSKPPPQIPQVDRTKKPGQAAPYKAEPNPREGSFYSTSSPKTNMLAPKVPRPPPDHSPRSVLAKPPTPSHKPPPNHQPPKVPSSTLVHVEKGLDLRWYVGMVTRGHAEAVLREVDMDGAFLVRDSSKRSLAQPYTLMVLNQGKVYNIQIRLQSDSYTLGTNHSESFPAVTEMIGFHTHTPLLLIDALDRSAGALSKCCLVHPAGS